LLNIHRTTNNAHSPCVALLEIINIQNKTYHSNRKSIF